MIDNLFSFSPIEKNKMKDHKIVVLGAGNLSVHLTQALYKAGFTILQVFSRKKESASYLAGLVDALPINDLEEIDQKAEIIIIAITDDAIPAVLEKLKINPDAVLIHTAGSVPLSVFNKQFRNTGVLYPFQTFSKFRPVAFDTLPVFVEANTRENLARIMSIARLLSSNVNIADSQQRERLHLSGIFVNNFVNYFYSMGSQLIKNAGFGFEVLKPLILETAMKAIESNNPMASQTGPAVRNNTEIIKKHIQLLASNPEIQNLYTFVSENILKTYHNQDHL
jgi:predicted short-subunit dehydrogenase-like oxidoreductase (DUF2520 family)